MKWYFGIIRTNIMEQLCRLLHDLEILKRSFWHSELWVHKANKRLCSPAIKKKHYVNRNIISQACWSLSYQPVDTMDNYCDLPKNQFYKEVVIYKTKTSINNEEWPQPLPAESKPWKCFMAEKSMNSAVLECFTETCNLWSISPYM
jgi:hypothetical protein